MPKWILKATLFIFCIVAGKGYFLFYFLLNYCYTWIGHQANVISDSGPVLISLVVLGSQLMQHLSWDLASCGWHVWIPGLLLSELWSLVAERQHAVCRANIVLRSSVSYLPFSGPLQLILLFQEIVFYIGPVAAGSLCLNGWICPCCTLFRIKWGADPAVLIAPGGKVVFISCEGRR